MFGKLEERDEMIYIMPELLDAKIDCLIPVKTNAK